MTSRSKPPGGLSLQRLKKRNWFRKASQEVWGRVRNKHARSSTPSVASWDGGAGCCGEVDAALFVHSVNNLPSPCAHKRRLLDTALCVFDHAAA